LRDLVRRGHYGRAVREVVNSLTAGTVLRQFTFRQARRYVPAIAESKVRMLRIPVEPVPIWGCDDLRARQVSDIDSYSVPALTHYEDRNASAHFLEVRHPFLDHRLVEFLVSLPAELKIRNGWTKYVLRQSLPELPPAIRWRKDKQPFLTPEALWLKNELRPVIGSMFANSKLEQIGVLNSKEFLRCYDDFLKARPIPPTDMSRVLIAEVWTRQFFG